jgi:hypothetical protein
LIDRDKGKDEGMWGNEDIIPKSFNLSTKMSPLYPHTTPTQKKSISYPLYAGLEASLDVVESRKISYTGW